MSRYLLSIVGVLEFLMLAQVSSAEPPSSMKHKSTTNHRQATVAPSLHSGTTMRDRGNGGKTITGYTQPFGSGTTTQWSNGSRASTQRFGSGTLTMERDRSGKIITGNTQRFGSGTRTQWSDGSSTATQRFGNGTLTTERDRTGKTITGTTQPFGSGTTTQWSNGSRTSTQRFGNGTLTTERPGNTSRSSHSTKK